MHYPVLKCPVFIAHDLSGFAFPSALTEGARRATEVSAENRRAPSDRPLFRPGSLAWLSHRQPLGRESCDQVRTVVNAQSSIQVLAQGHAAPRQRSPPKRLLDLQHPLIELHRVVAIHHALVLEGE